MSVNAGKNVTASRLGLGALLLLGIFAWAPALFPGYWQTLQGFVPVFNVGQYTPVAGIAVAPDLWRGAGSATNLLTQPWTILGFTPAAAVRMAYILAFMIGSCALYAWLRPIFGDRAAGLAGLVYILQPIFLTTVYLRGSLADALVLAWLPLAFAGLGSSSRQRGLDGAAVAVIAIIALWRTQAGLAALASVLLLAYALFVERHWIPVLVTITAGAAAAVTLLPFWSLSAQAPAVFADHFVYLYQFFDVRRLNAPSVAGWQDGYPFQLGFAVLAYGALALWGWMMSGRRRLASYQARLLGLAFGGGLLLIALSLGWSAGLWRLSGADQLLTYPWQLLLLAAPLLALAAGCLPVLLPELAAPPYWTVLVAVVVLAGYPYLLPTYTPVPPPARPLALLGANQLAILSAQLDEADGSTALDITWQVLQPLASDDNNIFFQAISDEGGDEQVVAQLDTQPLPADRPATSWQPGEIISGRYVLDLPAAPDDAKLRYYFGLYDWRSGRRLPVDGGIDDKLVLYGE